MSHLVLATREQDTFEKALAWQIEDFRKSRPDVSIEVVARPIAEHQRLMVEEGGAGKAGIDLFLCCTDWLPAAHDQSLILELMPEELPEDWPDAWHTSMQKLVIRDKSVIGVPWHDGPQMFIYRKDLFEEPDHKMQFLHRYGRPLEPPTTWPEFLETARYFTHPQNDEWGCVCAGLTDGHNNVYDFLIQLWSRGGVLFDEDWKPCFDSEIGVEGLEFLYDLYHTSGVISPQCSEMGSVESGDFFAQGKAAMMWNWCGFAAICEMPEYSNIVGKIGLGMLPAGDGGSVSLNIYWALTLAAGCSNREAATAFIRHAALSKCDKQTSFFGANGTKISTWRDAEVRSRYPHYEIIEQVHSSTRTLPAIPEYPELNELLSVAIDKVIHQHQPIKDSLQDAAIRARECLTSSGRLR
jgi:multiple sugar transport system substrate-binding protein